ncbi:hypothetical protein NT6N_18720 [Oceaniferula spumae]|uniref:Radical SAM core domain-containing protein n=1 Tax=Oceaniferula spumae TaxID=2979115 RepID=A0AAT9FL47_9BACT
MKNSALRNIHVKNAGLPSWYHVTVLSNFARGYDKYKKQYTKEHIPESSYPNQFFLLKKEELSIGIRKARKLLQKLNLPGDRLIVLTTHASDTSLRNDHPSGVAQYLAQDFIELDALHYIEEKQSDDKFELIPKRVEDVMADSFQVIEPYLLPWSELEPRTISILPIAMACQASCKFCFSKASVSSEFKGKIDDWSHITAAISAGKNAGVQRAVITGGGEPTLLEKNQLLKLIRQCSDNFSKTVLITNAISLAKQNPIARLETLRNWDDAGLSILAISRHHQNPEQNRSIMGCLTNSETVTETYLANASTFEHLTIRFICVLQKEGVSSVEDIEDYLTWSSRLGVIQVNFKELYVSTSNESAFSELEANDYSALNQVSLRVVHDFVSKHHWKQTNTLPWGAPIFQGTWHGRQMQIAAYTEPSVYWERTNGVARSWNLMSDGTLLASLEDLNSHIHLP